MNKIESKVIEKMQEMGGSFVVADPTNRQRIEAAFPEIWQSYLRLALNSEVAG